MISRQFNFNDRMRKIPQKLLTRTNLTWKDVMHIKGQVTNIEYSGILAYPYKHLPTMYISDEMTHGGIEAIVMPKFTIVSMLTNQTTVTDGIPNITSSGTIPQFIDQLTGLVVDARIDESYSGYVEGVNALMVPANGGSASTIPYSTDDDTIGLWNASTDASLVIGANIPYGITDRDVYQDIRGANLNYQTHDAYTTVTGGRVSIPFVDTSKIITFGSDADVVAATASGYASVWKKTAFLYFDGTSGVGRSGALLKSDLYGKFKLETGAIDGTRSVQTVAKVQSYDCRFPRDLSQFIQNYPGITALGTVTEGVPPELYLFARTILQAVGAEYTAAAVLHRIQEGAFGYARIELLK